MFVKANCNISVHMLRSWCLACIAIGKEKVKEFIAESDIFKVCFCWVMPSQRSDLTAFRSFVDRDAGLCSMAARAKYLRTSREEINMRYGAKASLIVFCRYYLAKLVQEHGGNVAYAHCSVKSGSSNASGDYMY